MKAVSTFLWAAVVLAGAVSSATANTIGLKPCDGVSSFVKSFSVAGGATITGVTFSNNDHATVFPSVALVRGGASSLNEGTVLRTATNVIESSSGVVSLTWSSAVSVSESATYYVAVTPPEGTGKQGAGSGPAIGATIVGSPVGSFVAGGAVGDLTPVGVDFDIALLGTGFGAGKARAEFPRVETYLAEPRPNPFNPTTEIEFGLERSGRLQLSIFDVSGRLVRSLVQASLPAGQHLVTWDGRDSANQPSAAGVYFARLTVASDTFQKKLVLVK